MADRIMQRGRIAGRVANTHHEMDQSPVSAGGLQPAGVGVKTMVINGKAAAAALVKARAAMKATVMRDAKANYGSYATLAAVMEAITPALVENGLALVQEAELGDGCITVGATLLHESGESIEFTPLSLPLGNQRTPQAAGSAIT